MSVPKGHAGACRHQGGSHAKVFVLVRALFAVSVATACGGASDDNSPDVEVASAAQALADCQATPTAAFCATTTPTPPLVSGRKVFYRVGASTGPGYDAATGRHAAVVLFQGRSDPNGFADDTVGGANGPGSVWNQSVPLNRDFGGYYQVATVVALVNAGYTVIQPAAHVQRLFGAFSPSIGYFWDTNKGIATNQWSGSPDQSFMNALIAQLQPAATTFGAIDIHHVYAMGISSGGYMTSRIANEYAGGVNANSTVKLTSKPFRAVAIESGAYQTCINTAHSGPPNPPGDQDCIAVTSTANLPATHAPTFFVHDDTMEPVVDFTTAQAYKNRLDALFPTNPNYIVNGVPEEFTRLHTFNGESPPPGSTATSGVTR
jgi:hypothetical protein